MHSGDVYCALIILVLLSQKPSEQTLARVILIFDEAHLHGAAADGTREPAGGGLQGHCGVYSAPLPGLFKYSINILLRVNIMPSEQGVTRPRRVVSRDSIHAPVKLKLVNGNFPLVK